MWKLIKVFVLLIAAILVVFGIAKGGNKFDSFMKARSVSVESIQAQANHDETEAKSNRTSPAQKKEDQKKAGQLNDRVHTLQDRKKKDLKSAGKFFSPVIIAGLFIAFMIATTDDEFYVDN